MPEDNHTHHRELMKIIKHYSGRDGIYATSIPSLSVIRKSTISEPTASVDEPSFCIIVQGEKEVYLGEERFRFGIGKYLVVSVDLPVTGQIITASNDSPYLALKIEFKPNEILDVLDETDIQAALKKNTKRAIFTSEVEPSLLDAVVRLTSLLDNPKHISKLAPLYKKEILYWILQGPYKDALEQIAIQGSNAFKIKNVIEHIISNYERSFRIGELTEVANMSVASLHRHFKEVTAMSPIQFQKQLRLQEARRLLLTESSDIADIAFKVGYESQSQFSREYSRMFGLPPKMDIKRIKENLNLNEQSV